VGHAQFDALSYACSNEHECFFHQKNTILKNWILLVFSTLYYAGVQAQEVKSDVLDTSVQLQIHATGGDTTQAYIPLVYLGNQEQINLLTSVADYLVKNENLPPLLIVGIDAFGSADWDQRLTQYTNYTADPLQAFLADELPAYLEQHFDTRPFRILAGQGDAAAYVFTVMMDRQDVYHAYICMAPALYKLPHPELAMRTFLVDHFYWDDFLYIAQGFGDDTRMKESLELSRLLNAHSVERPIDYHFRFFDHVKNNALLPEALPDALRRLFADLDLTIMLNYGGVAYLWDKRETLLSKYGYDPLNLRLPQIPVSRALLPVGLEQPNILAAQYELLRHQQPERYSFGKTDLLNLRRYFEAHQRQEAARHVQTIVDDRRYSLRQQKTNSLNLYARSEDLAYGRLLQVLDENVAGADALQVEGAELTHEPLQMIKFDGKDDYAIIQSDKLNNLTGSFSLSVWINPASAERFEAFISQAVEGDVKSHWRLGFGPMPETQWGLSVWNNAWKDYLINRTIPYNTWTHLAVVADQSLGQLTYYMDGEAVGKVEQLFPLFPTKEPVVIGRNNLNGGYFDGSLANLEIYDRGLSPAEVSTIFGKNKNKFQ
jgi:predicted alpha/beta superfamily hydrolase